MEVHTREVKLPHINGNVVRTDDGGAVVLLAFDRDAIIDFEDIKKKILSNGQNATDLQIIKI